MKSWFTKHPNWTVAIWWWGVPLTFGLLGFILGATSVNLDTVDDAWFAVFGLSWIGGVWYLCYRNLTIKQRNLSNLFWLLLGGIGVIIIMCLEESSNNETTA